MRRDPFTGEPVETSWWDDHPGWGFLRLIAFIVVCSLVMLVVANGIRAF